MQDSSGEFEGRTRALFARFRAGDREAERLLFEEHGDALLAFVRKRLPRNLRDRTEAEDVVSEVFRRALAGPLGAAQWQDRSPGGLKRLLSTIAKGVLVDLRRHHDAHKRRAGELHSPADAAARDPSQSSQAGYLELLELMRAELPEREWEIFKRVHVEGFQRSEVAAQLGETPEAVRAVLYRARQRLIVRLAAGGERPTDEERPDGG